MAVEKEMIWVILYFMFGFGVYLATSDAYEKSGCLLQGAIALISLLFWPIGLGYYVTLYLVKELAKHEH